MATSVKVTSLTSPILQGVQCAESVDLNTALSVSARYSPRPYTTRENVFVTSLIIGVQAAPSDDTTLEPARLNPINLSLQKSTRLTPPATGGPDQFVPVVEL